MEGQERARMLVAQQHNSQLGLDEYFVGFEDTQLVWFVYLLGGWKAMIITTRDDNLYYEVTYNKAKKETYVDTYQKVSNVPVADGNWIAEH